jgi:hypothetical protein
MKCYNQKAYSEMKKKESKKYGMLIVNIVCGVCLLLVACGVIIMSIYYGGSLRSVLLVNELINTNDK